jgi:hypothetical protein
MPTLKGMSFATPEDAARGDIPAEEVRVVGAIVRDDEAVVAQITNATGYPDAYETYTSHVYRDGDGWSSGMGSNGTIAVIPCSSSTGTMVAWCEAPAGAAAARFVLGNREATFPVEDGFVVAVFDDVDVDPYDGWRGYPQLAEWGPRDNP